VCTYDDLSMGYQALLFCPDEKTARTVTQVLSELDFSVIPCTEPFAAVKKLMGEHFDAVVVDCDNEQNATLLFKSARNAPNNHSSLAVAVVEGQAGVAKAFRIGANLVLTKPVNVEQAKGTLRVARGLLRKSEAAKPATGAASASVKPAAPSSQLTPKAVSSASAGGIIPPALASSASIPTPKPGTQPRVVASVPTEVTDADLTHTDLIDTDLTDTDLLGIESDEPAATATVAPEIKSAASHPEISAQTVKPSSSSGGFGTGAASAPAPARELKPSAAEQKLTTVVSEPVIPIEEVVASAAAVEETSAPALTFGGAVESGAKPSGGSKKALLAVAAVVLVAGLGYAVWMQWVRSGGEATPFTHVAPQPVTTAAKIPPVAPSAAPVAPSPDTSAAVPSTASAADSTVAAKDIATHNNATNKPSANKAPAAEEPAVKPAAQPIVVKSGNTRPSAKSMAAADAPAPSLTGIASAGNSAALPSLVSSGKVATPVLQVLHVSQGVSRGLLVKEVPPKYTVPELQRRIEGAVELMATVSKNGDITAVKVLSGDAQLAHSAVEAVKQWKYKPYLLDGEPIEIQTQITVNFKLPH
jgi:protein TonB